MAITAGVISIKVIVSMAKEYGMYKAYIVDDKIHSMNRKVTVA